MLSGNCAGSHYRFFRGNDFEDAVRNAVSLGGDTDTLAAITGSIAEAFFGISEGLKEECRDRIDDNLEKILKIFDDRISKQKDFLFRVSKYEGGYRLERNQNTVTICEQQGRLGLKILLKRLEYRLGIRLSFEEVKTIIDRDGFYVQTV